MTANPAFAADLLKRSARPLASAIAARMQDTCPDALAALPTTFSRPREDLEVRLLHLAAAVEFDRPVLFEYAVDWYKVALHHRGVGPAYLERGLELMAEVLAEELPAAVVPLVQRHLEAGRSALKAATVEVPSHLDKEAPHGLLACRFLLATLEGRADDAVALVTEALDAGLTIPDLHDQVLVPVQQEIGRMWLMGEIQIADEHYNSQVVERILWLAEERLARPPADAPKVLVLGVGGDLHGLGLRMISQRLRAAGNAVHELGSNMPAHDLEGALHEREFDLAAVGATMALNLHDLAATVAELRRIKGPRLPVVVGGRPFAIATGLGEALGADAAVADAAATVAAVQRLLARDESDA